MVVVETEHDEILLDMLMRTPGKAEIVDGRIIQYIPTGDEPGYAGDAITNSLWDYAQRTRRGRAVGDNKGFRCNLPRRKSFSPDAAYYTGPSGGMKFFPKPPIFAVEVRSENDYGSNMEDEMAQKRADYFAAGTLVVWDVDLLGEEVVRCYTAQNLKAPQIFRRGETASAEPAVPGWTVEVDRLFRADWEKEAK